MKNLIKIRPITIIFLATFLAMTAVYIISPEVRGPEIQGLSLVIPIAAALIGLYTSRLYGLKSANGRALLLITGGIVCWAAAETIWYLSDNFIASGSLNPSFADVFFLLGYPLFGVGVYQGFITAGVKLKMIKKPLLVRVLTVSLTLTALVAYFVIYQAYDPTADLGINILNITYGLGDLILIILSLLTILVANEYRDGKLALYWKVIALSFFLTLIGDIAYAMYGEQFLADVKPYTYIDLLWTAAYMLLAFGVLENYIHVSEVQNKIRLKLQQRQ